MFRLYRFRNLSALEIEFAERRLPQVGVTVTEVGEVIRGEVILQRLETPRPDIASSVQRDLPVL